MLLALCALAALALPPETAAASGSSGTGLSATVTAAGHLTSTTTWTIQKTGSPTTQTVAVGSNATVQWTIAVTKSASGSTGAYLDGQICATNTGQSATQGLQITDTITNPPSKTALNTVSVDVSSMPTIGAGQTGCYPYKITIPAASITPGATYKNNAQVTITNHSGHLGTPFGPSPSATAALPGSATPINSTITVNDTNGQTFTFNATGSHNYKQTIPCTTAGTTTPTNTATIQQTSQQATANVTLTCNNTWQTGDLTTYNQQAWGTSGIANSILANNYAALYGTTGFVIGLQNNGYFAEWFSESTLSAYLPANGTPGALNADLADPTTTSAGAFGGDVAALKLNVDFADAGLLPANSGIAFGNLLLCNLTSDTDLNGQTVRQVLGIANTAIGGGTTTDSITDLDALTVQLNNSFLGGTPSDWAQTHLCKRWKNGDLTTYDQFDWGLGGAANDILFNNFTSLYGSTGFVIGLPNPGFSATWTAESKLTDYLPTSGIPGALTANLVNPTTTSAGVFGGDVAALKLNVDFADAGLLTANLGLKFGDLILCNLTSDTDLNGQTVRQVLGITNTAIGGGSTTDSIPALDSIALDLTDSFQAGTPNAFAQNHLQNGSCT